MVLSCIKFWSLILKLRFEVVEVQKQINVSFIGLAMADSQSSGEVAASLPAISQEQQVTPYQSEDDLDEEGKH